MVSISNTTSIDYSTTGASSSWDYSSVSVDNQRIDTFYAVTSSSISYQVVFNNIFTEPNYVSDYYNNMQGFALGGGTIPGLSFGKTVEFTRYASSEVQKVGMGMNINGFDIPAKADTIDIQYELPLNYGSSWTSFSYVNLDLNPAFDGILRRHQHRTSTVDGWGTITTPFGTFDALRIKSDLTNNDSLYVGLIGVWQAIPTPDRHEYSWYANGQKIPVMKIVTTGSITEVVTAVEFKDKDRGFLRIEDQPEQVGVSYFPNPADDKICFNFGQKVQEFSVYNMQGELLYSDENVGMMLELSVSDWASGIYTAHLNAENGQQVVKFLVK